MKKFYEAPIGKNPQIVVLKVLIFRLDYITMYFADIKFLTRNAHAPIAITH